MQNNKFYAGHSMEWMNKFIESIPKKKKYHLGIAAGLATAINHLSICKKRNDNLVLEHTILEEFGLGHKHISRYLLCFERAGLIEVTLKNGAAPKVKLLLIDPLRYVPNYKQLQRGNKRNLDQKDQVPRPNSLGHLDQIIQVINPRSKGPKEPRVNGNQKNPQSEGMIGTDDWTGKNIEVVGKQKILLEKV